MAPIIENIIKQNTHYTLGKSATMKWFAVLLIEILLAGFATVYPLFSLIILIVVTVFIILLIKPEYSLYILCFLVIPGGTLTFTLYEVTQKFYHLFVIAVLFYWSLARTTKKLPSLFSTGVNQPLLIFLAWALLSLTWSHNRILGTEDIIKLTLSIASLFLIKFFINESKTFCIALWVFIFMATIDAIIASMYPYSGGFIRKEWNLLGSIDIDFKYWFKHFTHGPGGRMMGSGVAHATAVMLSFAMTFCMMFFLVTQNKKKRIALLCLVLFLYAIMVGTLTKSMVASILISSVYIILHLKLFRQHLIAILLVICMVTVVSFVITRSKNIERAVTTVTEGVKIKSDVMSRTSAGGRFEKTKIGLQKLWETGGLGTGIGGFIQYTSSEHLDGSHPSVLWDLGFVGMASWVWLLMGSYRLFVNAIKKSNNEYFRRMLIIYLGGYVNVIISWFFTFEYANRPLWFYLGIGYALVHLSQTVPFDRNQRLPFSRNGEESIVIV